MRWNNKAIQNDIRSLKFGQVGRDPKPIEVNLEKDWYELSLEEQKMEASKKEVAFQQSVDGQPVPGDKQIRSSYMNPFERVDQSSLRLTGSTTKPGKPVEIGGAPDPDSIGLVKRKYRIEFDKGCLQRIEQGREQYDKWLKLHNNTSNKKVWEAYDHIAADLTHEILSELMGTIDKDLDSFCEKVIIDEF